MDLFINLFSSSSTQATDQNGASPSTEGSSDSSNSTDNTGDMPDKEPPLISVRTPVRMDRSPQVLPTTAASTFNDNKYGTTAAAAAACTADEETMGAGVSSVAMAIDRALSPLMSPAKELSGAGRKEEAPSPSSSSSSSVRAGAGVDLWSTSGAGAGAGAGSKVSPLELLVCSWLSSTFTARSSAVMPASSGKDRVAEAELHRGACVRVYVHACVRVYMHIIMCAM